ncbi:MAG: glycosyltransferase [Patescibacteria group bacterium]|jgi:glycosyltransferase involved in cell wall biosynthesis
MKILQVNKFHYLKGGAERYYLELARMLRRNAHQVSEFSMEDPANLTSAYSRYFVSNLSKEPGLKNWFFYPFRVIYGIEAKKKFEKLIIEFRPDVIHIHNIYHQISPSILGAAKKHGVPVIMHLHDYKLVCPNAKMFCKGKVCEKCKGGKFYNCFLNRCIDNSAAKSLIATIEMYFHRLAGLYEKNVNLYIAPSNFLRDKIIEWGIDAEKIIYFPYFVDEIESGDNEKGNNKNKGNDYFLYYGRLSEEKGVGVIIDALALMDKKPKLLIVGTGPMESLLRDKTKELDLRDHVEFTGYKSGQELGEIIKKAKAVIIPSVWYENMPFTVTEAMLAGKIVIASDIGGISELVQGGKSGKLFKPGSAGDLAGKISAVYNNEDAAEKTGFFGSDYIKNSFNGADHLARIEKIYAEIVDIKNRTVGRRPGEGLTKPLKIS